MRILVTGGNGLVGRNIVECPRAATYDISAPSRKQLNLLDRAAVAEYIGQLKPDVVIHAAGRVAGITANMRFPAEFLSENFRMGLNVVESARDSGVKALINLGSSCMYPRYAENPLREESVLTGELEPTNEGYAIAKIAIQRLCSYISRENSELKYITLIPCNLYGRYDSFDPAKSHMLPAAIHKVHEAVMDGKSTVQIWGDGLARREHLYAGDLADLVFFLIPKIHEVPEILNVGPGVDQTINEYYAEVAAVLGYDGRFEHDLTKPVGMARKVVDTSKLNSLGWTPPTDLRSGIAATYEYYVQSQGERRK